MSAPRIAIVPGSFDPITNGHLDIIRRAAASYDTVYVAVMINPQKTYCFDMKQRTEIAKAAVEGMENVFVISSDGMLWKLAEDLHACAIVKGVRNEIDRKYEEEMARFNDAHNPNARTVLLDADPSWDHLSSTLVREKLRGGEPTDECLPANAVGIIDKFLNEKR